MALIALLCIFMVAVEVGTRAAVVHISRIEGRTEREYRDAFAPVPAGKPLVLLVGNSLLDAAVQMDNLRNALASRFEVRRFMIEQTAYHDWHYGLRRLYAEGLRPSTVILVLNPYQMSGSGSRGDYSAYRLVAHNDILSFCRNLGLSPTDSAGMILANYSMFYGLRGEIRKVLLGHILPELPLLTRRFLPPNPPPVPDRVLGPMTRERMALLRDEASRYGAHIVLAVPPGLSFNGVAVMAQASAEAGVRAIVPFGPADFHPEDFSDRFHANALGAAKYTRALIQQLRMLPDRWQ